jgi:anti-sigma factor RsiW
MSPATDARIRERELGLRRLRRVTRTVAAIAAAGCAAFAGLAAVSNASITTTHGNATTTPAAKTVTVGPILGAPATAPAPTPSAPVTASGGS